MRLKETGWEDVDCIYLVQTRNRWKGKKILVSIKCRETDEVSKHQLFRKLNHTQNWNILCTFIIALFTARSNKISKKATFLNSRLHMK
jgi:transcriptional regulator of met regulon